MSGSAFQLTRVSARFGATTALADVSLVVQPGEAVALVGPSGAGKTTILRLLNGSVRPDKGAVSVNGVDLASIGRRQMQRLRTSVAFIRQDLGLVPNLRVSQNVMAGRLGRQSLLGSVRSMLLPARAELKQVDALLERVGIPEKLFERLDRLSGGEQQRVALARALYQDPSALLADEPVSSVDPARAQDTVDLLTRISREESLTLCMSTHNLELAREYFGRLVGLRNGHVVFDRAAADIGDAEFHALYDLRDRVEPADAE